FTLRARAHSVRYALWGLRFMLRTQHNAGVHAAATLFALAAGLLLRIDRLEWCAVIVVIVAVWTAEALNTAFEALCDVASPEFHPMVERAKDVAAGAVLISAIGSTVVGAMVFVPRLIGL